jgi:hypothetical protein
MLIVFMRRGFGALAVLFGLAMAVGPSSGASGPAVPADFVGVSLGSGQRFLWDMSLYSSSTGAVTRRLASFGQLSFTNNGAALAPDGSAVYVTLIPRHSRGRFALRLLRIDVATRRQTLIADGEQPAISDDGSQLAYGAATHGLAVRDLATSTMRTIGVVAQLGKAADLLDASLTWLADGTDIAIIPSPPAWDLVGRRPPPARWCNTTDTHAVIVFVHVPPAPAPLTADCVRLAGKPPTGAIALAESPASPGSLMLAADDGRDAVIEQITQTGAGTDVLTIRDSLPCKFDRSGTHLLYLVGHNPPALWAATIANGRLTDKRRLNSKAAPIAW